MKKKIIIICILLVVISTLCFFTIGKTRNDVVLYDYKVDSNKITIKVGVSSSAGYIRSVKETKEEDKLYLTFYSTLGINLKFGSKDTFDLDVSDINKIYFSFDSIDKLVLEKNDGEWTLVKTSETKDDVEKIELEDVTLSIKEGTLTKSGATFIITDLSDEENVYGEGYIIEKKIGEEWIELKPIIDNYGFNMIGYLVDENNTLELDHNWEWLYGKLDSGEYKLIKVIDYNTYISCEFKID